MSEGGEELILPVIGFREVCCQNSQVLLHLAPQRYVLADHSQPYGLADGICQREGGKRHPCRHLRFEVSETDFRGSVAFAKYLRKEVRGDEGAVFRKEEVLDSRLRQIINTV